MAPFIKPRDKDHPTVFPNNNDVSGQGMSTNTHSKRPWNGCHLVNFNNNNNNKEHSFPHPLNLIRPASLGFSASTVPPTNTTHGTSPSPSSMPISVSHAPLHPAPCLSSAESNSQASGSADLEGLISLMKTHKVSEQPRETRVDSNNEKQLSSLFNFTFNDTSLSSASTSLSSSDSPVALAASAKESHPVPTDTPTSQLIAFHRSQFSFPPPTSVEFFNGIRNAAPLGIKQPSVAGMPPPPAKLASSSEGNHVYHTSANDTSTLASTTLPSSRVDQDATPPFNDPNLPIRVFPDSKYIQLQYRKILPLPTKRSKRKTATAGMKAAAGSDESADTSSKEFLDNQVSSENSPTDNTDSNLSVWDFPAATASQTDNPTAADDGPWMQDSEAHIPSSNESQPSVSLFSMDHDASHPFSSAHPNEAGSRESAKKLKCSRVYERNREELPIATPRQRERWCRVTENDRPGTSFRTNLQATFPDHNFEFSLDPAIQPNWDQLSALNDACGSTATEFGHNATRNESKAPSSPIIADAPAQSPEISKAVRSTETGAKKKKSSRRKKGKPGIKQGEKELDPQHIKTSVSASGSQMSASSTSKKKSKKGQRKKEQEAPSLLSTDLWASDLSMIRSALPEDWICLFCQYDIFCNGLMKARQKNGYYKRLRERQRRLKEAEDRRLCEASSTIVSDTEDDQWDPSLAISDKPISCESQPQHSNPNPTAGRLNSQQRMPRGNNPAP
ncbi:uncharacterized protein BYT42DRAFT_242234 [Radiomyces spectabilis]|uniref:uncharacterized protein n=1 Tax=Radiomyces spectabilis TaxID=64574 RepID=UPI002220B137|nr:uncharacterized protein BYT42DRAFT_242234 [Radiomyces spectabilis]KAI8388660.1 hypothetical protein BYT42DRAFT_242234 [Radiomyces spectabilis]